MKLIYGCDPSALRRLAEEPKKSPLANKELARLGIPARKIPRVREELARLAEKDMDRATLLKLAIAIAGQLL